MDYIVKYPHLRTNRRVANLQVGNDQVRRPQSICRDAAGKHLPGCCWDASAGMRIVLILSYSSGRHVRYSSCHFCQCVHVTRTEADLGMFSMFGRTGAPTKRGPPQKDNKHISITPILPHSLTVCFRKAGLKLPVSCCCNSSVHCSTGPQQNVDDDCCACLVKAVGVFIY